MDSEEMTGETRQYGIKTASPGKNGKIRLTFYDVMPLYLVGGFVGTLWETLLNLAGGNGFVFCNGSLFTPYNFVYGSAAVLIVACLKNQTKWWKIWLIGAFGGGTVEYVLNFLEEKLFGTRSWNYDNRPLNINGRTTIIYMAFWGILCVAVVLLIYRPFKTLINRIPKKVLKIFSITAAAVVAADLILTAGALIRYSQRNAGNSGIPLISEIYDRYCDDDFMRIHFPRTDFT